MSALAIRDKLFQYVQTITVSKLILNLFLLCIFASIKMGSYGFDSRCDFYVSMPSVVNMARKYQLSLV